MYKFLLSKLDQDVYDLFAYFLDSSSEHVKLTELSTSLGFTKRQITAVIERIVAFQKEYPFYEIEIINTRELCLRFSPNFLLSKLYSVMLEESIPFQILDRIFKEKYISLENTAQQYYVSNRTVQRKLREADTILSNYKLKLNLKNRSLIIGEEYRIRYFFHIMYWQIFDGNNTNCFGFNKNSINELKKKIQLYPTYYRNIDQEKFIQLLTLSMYRLKRGFALENLPIEMKEMGHLNISFEQFREELIDPVFSDNYLLEKATDNEYIFLYYMFSVMTTYLPTEICNSNFVLNNFSAKSLEVGAVFTETAQRFFALDDNAKGYLLINALTIHSTSLLFATENKVDAFGKTTIDKDYIRVFPKIYPIVQEMFDSLEQQFPIFRQLYQSNKRLLFQYTMLLSIVIKETDKPIRIFHEVKFGKIQDIRQKQQLYQTFGEKIVFVLENPDIVITDYPVYQQTFIDQNNKVIFFKWHSFPSTEKWLELIDVVENYERSLVV